MRSVSTFESLRAENPGLILCSVTPFGQTGPYSSYKGTDMHAEAMGGLMLMQGDPDRQPVMSPAFLGYSVTGTHAAIGIMNALFAREHSGSGQRIDVSMLEATANILFIVSQFGYNGAIAQRPGSGGGGGTGVFECSDGWIGFSPIQPNQFIAFAEWTGNEIIQDEMFRDLAVRQENRDLINSIATEFFLTKTVAEAVEEAQARRIPADARQHPRRSRPEPAPALPQLLPGRDASGSRRLQTARPGRAFSARRRGRCAAPPQLSANTRTKSWQRLRLRYPRSV